MTIFDAKNQTFDGFQTSKNGKSSFSVPGKVASPRVGARPTMVTAGIVIHCMKICQTRWTIKHGRFLASNLGILASNKGECRFKHGEFEILTPNIGKIVKPESKMSRMEVYSKNHDIFNIIYVIMCMGRAVAIGFFHVVNAESWRLGIGNDHEKIPWAPCQCISLSALPRWGFRTGAWRARDALFLPPVQEPIIHVSNR